MSTNCHLDDGDWTLLLLGVLEEPHASSMRGHIQSGCPSCRLRWAEARRLLAGLGETLDPLEPPRHVEERLRARLASEDPTVPARSAVPRLAIPRPEWTLVAAVAVLAATAVSWLAVEQRDLRQRLAATEARLAAALRTEPPATAGSERPADPTPPLPPSPEPPEQRPPGSARADEEWARERAALEQARDQAEASLARAELETARLTAALAEAEGRATRDAPPQPPIDRESPRVAELQEEVQRLSDEVSRLQGQVARGSAATREYASALAAFADARVSRATLRPIDPAAGSAVATAALTPDGRLLLMARELPQLPADKCYQLWVIRRDNPAIVSGGVLTVGEQGVALHLTRVEGEPESITGFALTDEPAGGSVASRGRKLLFGAVSQ